MRMNLILHLEEGIAVETPDVLAVSVSVSERAEAPRKRDFRVSIRLH